MAGLKSLTGIAPAPTVSSLGVVASAWRRTPGAGGTGKLLFGTSTTSTVGAGTFVPGSPIGGGGTDDPSYRYVRLDAAVGGNGRTWNATSSDGTHALNAIPATPTRGLTYWLADGNYGDKAWTTPVLGTTPVTIKKATVASHGTNTGWVDTLGDGQAVFGYTSISTSYWVFDGQRRNTDWHTGAINQYGIRIKTGGDPNAPLGSRTSGGRTLELFGTVRDITFSYVDFENGGRDTGTSNSDVVYGLSGPINMTFSRCALHDSNRVIFLTRGNWQNLLLEFCWIARNASHPDDADGGHGEFISMTSVTNVIARYNYFEDIEGSAVFMGLGSGSINGMQIYGNVFHWTAAYIANTGRDNLHNFGVAGAVYIADDANNPNQGNNIKFYNNTIYNCPGSYSGVFIQRSTLGGNEVRNCLWESCVRTNNSMAGGTISHCWYRNTPVDGDTSATRQNGTSNPFVNAGARNFHLVANTNAGFTLASPYNVDMDGVTRATWSRGAFEMV